MSTDLDPALDLDRQLHQLLRETVDGCSEYALIQQLKTRRSRHIPNLPLSDKLVLFRSHFLVFAALYRLRDRLWADASAHLEIGPLHIQLHPYRAGFAGLAEQDPLRDYYLDPANLQVTTEEDVERLLASFWKRLRAGDQRRAALEQLELEPDAPLDLATIKHRYRQLVARHHPDRGGSTARLQSINQAMEILAQYYG